MLNHKINFYFLFFYRKARRKERDDAEKGDTKLYLDESVLELLKFTPADLRTIVDMPAGLDFNEWLASYSEYQLSHLCQYCGKLIPSSYSLLAIQIFEYVNLVYGTISEHCTTTGCPDMTAPQSK